MFFYLELEIILIIIFFLIGLKCWLLKLYMWLFLMIKYCFLGILFVFVIFFKVKLFVIWFLVEIDFKCFKNGLVICFLFIYSWLFLYLIVLLGKLIICLISIFWLGFLNRIILKWWMVLNWCENLLINSLFFFWKVGFILMFFIL